MRIKCHECGRSYNWADDCFCPHCGAFNQKKGYGFDREEAPTVRQFDPEYDPNPPKHKGLRGELEKVMGNVATEDSASPFNLPKWTANMGSKQTADSKKSSRIVLWIFALIFGFNLVVGILSFVAEIVFSIF